MFTDNADKLLEAYYLSLIKGMGQILKTTITYVFINTSLPLLFCILK